MPGVLGRPPGWQRRGCRRLPRTRRTARSRRPATRRPHQAGPARSRRGQLLRPGLRTGALRSAVAEGCLGQEPLAESLQGQRLGPAGPAPLQRIRGEVKEHLAGKRVVSRVQGRKLAQQLSDVSVAGQAVEQDTTGSHGILGGRPLPARHVTTVDQNRQPRAAFAGDHLAPRPCNRVKRSLVTLGRYLRVARHAGTAVRRGVSKLQLDRGVVLYRAYLRGGTGVGRCRRRAHCRHLVLGHARLGRAIDEPIRQHSRRVV